MNNPNSELKGMDLVRWLDTKLGNPDELWSGRQAASVLSREVLNELATCFQALEPVVKLKIIESIPHLSPKLIQMWRDPLNRLLNVARNDADNWIHTIAKLYMNFPNTYSINCDEVIEVDKQFSESVANFQRILTKSIPDMDCNPIPPDHLIVTPAAIQMNFGYSSEECSSYSQEQVSLRQASKAELMLQDALKMSQTNNPQQQNQVKRNVPAKIATIPSSLPIKVRSTARQPNNSLPMRGIPSIPVSRISSGFSNEPRKFYQQRSLPSNKFGGAMLIDIQDLPQAPGVKKKRGKGGKSAEQGEEDGTGKKKLRKGKSQDEDGEDVEDEGSQQNGERPNPISTYSSFKPINFQRATSSDIDSIQPRSVFNSNPFAPSSFETQAPSYNSNPFAPSSFSPEHRHSFGQPFAPSPPQNFGQASPEHRHPFGQPFAPSPPRQNSGHQPFGQPFAPSNHQQGDGRNQMMPAKKLDNSLIDGPFSFI